ncbi:hypothetical protein N431DRAFT_564567 [Stipitochalara longipes BDJ]|nr:hypothetical protein N431DRAFT_564567 [Stipitochalara longipes BDJ]
MSRLIFFRLLCIISSIFSGDYVVTAKDLDDCVHGICEHPATRSSLQASSVVIFTSSLRLQTPHYTPPSQLETRTSQADLLTTLAPPAPSIASNNGSAPLLDIRSSSPMPTHASSTPANSSSNSTTLSTDNDDNDVTPNPLFPLFIQEAVAEEGLWPKSDVPKISPQKDGLLSHLGIFDLARDIQVFSPDVNLAQPHVLNANGRDGVNLKRTWDSAHSLSPESLLFRHSGYESILAPFSTAANQSSGSNEHADESENRGQLSSFAPALLWLFNHEDERQRKRRRFDNPDHSNPHRDDSPKESPPAQTPEKLRHSNPDNSFTLAMLVAEVKGIYAGLAMVEAKCIEVDKKQTNLALNAGTNAKKLIPEQWQALTALHRTLLCEHFDFFMVSQHPVASPAVKRLASKYAMPARMWRHGVHSYLELLRHGLPESFDHMLTFIYLAYVIIAVLYECNPAFEDTWMECLGDLGRYRMAIEDDDIRDRETWTQVARHWYSKRSAKAPETGRLYHHLAIMSRPHAYNQLFFYLKSLSTAYPFHSSRESIQTLFELDFSRVRPVQTAPFVERYSRIHAHLLGYNPGNFQEILSAFVTILDGHIGVSSHHFIRQGSQLAVSNCAALLCFGSKESVLARELLSSNSRLNGAANTPEDAIEPSDLVVFHESRRLFLETFQTVLRRPGDQNIRSFVNSILVFILHLSSSPGAMTLMEEYIPWQDLIVVLNSYTRCSEKLDEIEKETFPGLHLKVSQPLPEDFDLRGLVWSQGYFPDNWFSNSHIEDEQEYMKDNSTSQEDRLERILWLGFRLARRGLWMYYDSSDRQFSVPNTLVSDEELPDSPAYELDFHMSPSVASSFAASNDTGEELSDSTQGCCTSDEARSTSKPLGSQLTPSELVNPLGTGPQIDFENQATQSKVASPLNAMVGIDYDQALFDELPFAQFFEFGDLMQEQYDHSTGAESTVVKVTSHVDPTRIETGHVISGDVQSLTFTTEPCSSPKVLGTHEQGFIDPLLLQKSNTSSLPLPLQHTYITGDTGEGDSGDNQGDTPIWREDQKQDVYGRRDSHEPSEGDVMNVDSASSLMTPSDEQTSPQTSSAQYTCPRCSNTYPRRCDLNKHMTIHTRPHNCPIQSCTRTFATRKDLTRHLHDRHSDNFGRTSVLCNHLDCADEQSVFGRRDNLRRHWRLCHGRNPREGEAWFIIA